MEKPEGVIRAWDGRRKYEVSIRRDPQPITVTVNLHLVADENPKLIDF